MFSSELQSLKAPVTCPGPLWLHFSLFIYLIAEGAANVTLCKLEQPSKAPSPNTETEAGITTCFSDLQLVKAPRAASSAQIFAVANPPPIIVKAHPSSN